MEANIQKPVASGNKYAPRGWKKKKSDTFEIEFEDQVILVRKLGIKEIIQAGLINDLDTFTGQLLPDGTNSNGDVNPNNIILDAMKDAKKFNQFEQTVDKVVMICVVEPKVYSIPPKDHERDPEKVYVDEIDIEDKMTIFGHCFSGMGNMSRFPGGQGGDMEPVAEVSGSPVATESHGGVPSGVS